MSAGGSRGGSFGSATRHWAFCRERLKERRARLGRRALQFPVAAPYLDGRCFALPAAALLEEFVGVADRHCEVGAAEALQDGKVHADYFAATVEERAAGASGSGSRVVDDFVLQHVADVALRRGRPDQLLGTELRNKVGPVAGVVGNLVAHSGPATSQEAFDA